MKFGKWIHLTIQTCNDTLYLFIYLFIPDLGFQIKTIINQLTVVSMVLIPMTIIHNRIQNTTTTTTTTTTNYHSAHCVCSPHSAHLPATCSRDSYPGLCEELPLHCRVGLHSVQWVSDRTFQLGCSFPSLCHIVSCFRWPILLSFATTADPCSQSGTVQGRLQEIQHSPHWQSCYVCRVCSRRKGCLPGWSGISSNFTSLLSHRNKWDHCHY
jgi:hypothetical protein